MYKIRAADANGEWTVSRRYSNFEQLHRQLRDVSSMMCVLVSSSYCPWLLGRSASWHAKLVNVKHALHPMRIRSSANGLDTQVLGVVRLQLVARCAKGMSRQFVLSCLLIHIPLNKVQQQPCGVKKG